MGLFDFFKKKKEIKADSLLADDALDEFLNVEKKQGDSRTQFEVDLQAALLQIGLLGGNNQEDLSKFIPKGEFGYTETNPVMVTNIANGYHYLNRLECVNGDPIKYSRIGSMRSSVLQKPLDIYNITNAKTGEILKKIYIYGYGNEMSLRTPEGLRFK
jgi:hypothetical protein